MVVFILTYEHSSYRHAGCIASGPCDLQIETAGVCITVNDLASKIESGHQLGCHGFRIDFPHFNAAGSNDRFRNGPFTPNLDRKAF